MDYLTLALRWLHIMAAIALVGGAIFQRLALVPAIGELPEDQRNSLKEAIRRRWAKVVMLGILLLLVSGFVNMIVTIRSFNVFNSARINSTTSFPQSVAHLLDHLKLDTTYHMLIGIKILLALVIFFFASALVGKSKALAGFRDKASTWLLVNIVLAMMVVGMASYLRAMHTGPNVGAIVEVFAEDEANRPADYDPEKSGPPPDPDNPEKAGEELNLDFDAPNLGDLPPGVGVPSNDE